MKKAKDPIRCLSGSVSPDGGSQGRGCGRAAVTPGCRVFEGDTFKVRLVVTDVFSRSSQAAIIPLGAARLHAPFSPPAVAHLEATCATLVFEPPVPTGASAQLTFSHPSCLREKKTINSTQARAHSVNTEQRFRFSHESCRAQGGGREEALTSDLWELSPC